MLALGNHIKPVNEQCPVGYTWPLTDLCICRNEMLEARCNAPPVTCVIPAYSCRFFFKRGSQRLTETSRVGVTNSRYFGPAPVESGASYPVSSAPSSSTSSSFSCSLPSSSAAVC